VRGRGDALCNTLFCMRRRTIGGHWTRSTDTILYSSRDGYCYNVYEQVFSMIVEKKLYSITVYTMGKTTHRRLRYNIIIILLLHDKWLHPVQINTQLEYVRTYNTTV